MGCESWVVFGGQWRCFLWSMVAEVWTLGGGFGWHILEHPQQICPMCQMPNIWHIWHTKHKNGALSDVLNLKNYATFYSTISNMRQYGQQLQNQILLFYCVFLSTLPQISLSLCQLYLVSSPQLATDLTASCSNPRRQHPQPSLPTFRSLLIRLWV